MRKVTREAVQAFNGFRRFTRSGNGETAVEVEVVGGRKVATLRLHGRAIARHTEGEPDSLEVHDGGYQSLTTKERLNGLPGVRVWQSDFQWYLNGVAWDGRWINVAAARKAA